MTHVDMAAGPDLRFLIWRKSRPVSPAPECPLRRYIARRRMSLSWIVLGLVGWALGLLFVLALMRMAGDQDRAARHEQRRLDPLSDVTITRFGND